MLKVIVIEDDPMVAQINRVYLGRLPKVSVEATLPNGREALKWLKGHQADLAVLDVYMPDLNGLEFLRLARSQGIKIDALMVTAANDPSLVEELLRLGVVDYLVKPFTEARFIEAMVNYMAKKETLNCVGGLYHARIDRLLGGVVEGLAPELSKGLQPATWNLILDSLAQGHGQYMNCEDVAARVELSKVTIRRYLKNMAAAKLLDCRVDYETGGRPSVRYRVKRV
ncbi:MAG: response regulator [Deltaproteobacteria bacterium]|jgi:response regulator of citrate/malate metabolism|nr:response regulator [Deltaproteobacteria bacterium]